MDEGEFRFSTNSLFLEEGEVEGERGERNINVWLSLTHT